MFESFLIMFREVFEAAIIIGVVLGILTKTNRSEFKKFVLFGSVSGIAASVVGAILFNVFAGGFEGRYEEIFEGTTMLIGAILLSSMIIWMMKNSNVKAEIESKLSSSDSSKLKFEIFLLTFFSIVREGVEAVIFLNAAAFASKTTSILGAVLGVVVGVLIAFAMYKGFVKVNMKKFFIVINVLFILFAASLISHGVAELEEAHVLPPVIEHIFGTAKAESENEAFNIVEYGEEFVTKLIGFNSAPSLVQAVSYFGYLGLMIVFWRRKSLIQKKVS